MIELVRHAHGRRLRSSIVWGVSLGLLGLMMIGIYSTLDVSVFTKALESYPQGLLDAFGISAEAYATPEGFISGELLSFMVPLAVGFYPILAASRAIAGAEQNRSLDVVLGQPVPRWQVPVSTFLAFLIGLFEVVLLFCLLTWLSALAFGVDLNLGHMAAGSLNLVPLALLYGGLALAISAGVRQPGLVTGIAGGGLVLAYLLDAVGKISADVDWLADITPFRFYGVAIEDGLDAGDVGLLILGALIFLGISIPVFARRDVRA
ncbi:MAG: ABC transporter permease subunit [Solirubrobacteraceae bacterium]|nr:ABC transporter permease subunit [Solirubrobacteraceae bacterium]